MELPIVVDRLFCCEYYASSKLVEERPYTEELVFRAGITPASLLVLSIPVIAVVLPVIPFMPERCDFCKLYKLDLVFVMWEEAPESIIGLCV